MCNAAVQTFEKRLFINSQDPFVGRRTCLRCAKYKASQDALKQSRKESQMALLYIEHLVSEHNRELTCERAQYDDLMSEHNKILHKYCI